MAEIKYILGVTETLRTFETGESLFVPFDGDYSLEPSFRSAASRNKPDKIFEINKKADGLMITRTA